MATDNLKIILQAFFKGKGEITSAQREIGKLDQIAGKVGKGLKMLAGVGATAAVAIGAISAAALKQGSELELLRSRFDNLAKSIGTTSSALLGDMRTSSQGMVSNANLMAGATDLMAMKLAKTHEQVMRLSTVSNQLGWDMGVLALTINNQSVMRLDNLGLAVEDVIPRFKELQATMSDKEAFTLALIEAGEKNLELLGSKAETAAGKIAQLIAVGENAKDAFAQSFAVTVTSQLEELAGGAMDAEAAFVSMAAGAGDALANLVLSIRSAIIGVVDLQIQLAQFQQMANAALPDWALANPTLTRNQDMATLQNLQVLRAGLQGSHVPNTSAHMTARDMAMIGAQTNMIAGATDNLASSTDNLTGANRGLSYGQFDLNRALAESGRMKEYDRQKTRELADEIEEATGGVGSFTSAIDDAINEMYTLAAQTGDFFMQARKFKDGEYNPFESLLESADKYGAHALQLADIGVGGGLFSQEEATKYLRRTALMHRADQLGQLIARGQIDAAGAVGQLDSLHKALYEGRIDVADEFFAGLPVQEETDIESNLHLVTDAGWIEYTMIKDQIESNPPTVVLNVVNPGTEADREQLIRPPGPQPVE